MGYLGSGWRKGAGEGPPGSRCPKAHEKTTPGFRWPTDSLESPSGSRYPKSFKEAFLVSIHPIGCGESPAYFPGAPGACGKAHIDQPRGIALLEVVEDSRLMKEGQHCHVLDLVKFGGVLLVNVSFLHCHRLGGRRRHGDGGWEVSIASGVPHGVGGCSVVGFLPCLGGVPPIGWESSMGQGPYPYQPGFSLLHLLPPQTFNSAPSY